MQHDAESRKALDAINAEIGTRASELQSFDDAMSDRACQVGRGAAGAGAEQRAAGAHGAEASRTKEFSELGPFLDKATDNLRRGLLALQQNAASVGKDSSPRGHVAPLPCWSLFSALPLRDAFGVPGHNDRRSFSSFSGVVNQWCDGNDAALRHELEALDGREQTNKEEAA